MCIELVTDPDHLLRIGIVQFEKIVHLMSPILLGSVFVIVIKIGGRKTVDCIFGRLNPCWLVAKGYRGIR